MYCAKCGQKIADNTNFCPSCGIATQAPEPVRESDTPVLTTRPVFIPWATWLGMLPIHLFLTVWGAGFFGGFSMFAVRALGITVPTGSTFVFFGLVFFLGFPLLTYISQKKTYANTTYTFYNTKLDYFEGFFTREKKTIDYRHITEVNLREGIIQKRYGMGTIILSTPATGLGSGRARSGIRVADILHADRVYDQVRALIERANARAA